MARFAKIENDIVTQVIVIDDENITGKTKKEKQEKGTVFIKNHLKDKGEWVLYEDSGPYSAAIGYTYDRKNKVFIAPKPFNSWVLDENFMWQPPVPYPSQTIDENNLFYWDEAAVSWKPNT